MTFAFKDLLTVSVNNRGSAKLINPHHEVFKLLCQCLQRGIRNELLQTEHQKEVVETA